MKRDGGYTNKRWENLYNIKAESKKMCIAVEII